MLNNELSKFWTNKNVLITGHTGFKGSWLCIFLSMLGANIIGYALDPYTDRDNYVLCGLDKKVTDIRGDVRDINKLTGVFHQYRPEVVFHLAAQSLVLQSYIDPKETYEVNLMGTLNILECIRNTDFPISSVIVTTDKCYENKEQIWGYRENDILGGYDPYASSKACTEILVSSYRNSFMNTDNYSIHKKAIASARAGNAIGGGDWSKNRIIPDCIKALENGNPVEIRNPHASRPWQHVIEPLYGYILLAQNLYNNPCDFSEAWNFGPGNDRIVKVLDIVRLLAENWDGSKFIETYADKDLHEANTLTLDSTKAAIKMDWSNKLSIKETVEMTALWYKNYRDADVYDLCQEQIKCYLKGDVL